MTKKYRYLGCGITNTDGVAVLDHDPRGHKLSKSYTSQGNGEIDVVAKISKFTSPTTQIEDYIKYDRGIKSDYNNSIWSTSITRRDEYSALVYKTTVLTRATSIPSRKTIIEFDLNIECLANSNIITLRNGSSIVGDAITKSRLELSNNTWYHIKLVLKDTVCDVYVDNVLKISNQNITGVTNFYFRVGNGDNELRFRNFKMYKNLDMIDYVFYDPMTTDTGNWDYDTTKVNVAYSNDGIHVTSITGTGVLDLNINGSTHSIKGTSDLIFEFDFKTANQCYLYLFHNGGSRIRIHTITAYGTTFQHFLWKYDATNHTLTPYIDGAVQTSIDLSEYNMTTLGFSIVDWNEDADFYFKNFKIYNNTEGA